MRGWERTGCLRSSVSRRRVSRVRSRTVGPGRSDAAAVVPAAAGVGAAVGGLVLVGVGVWARRDVARALARERIVSTADARPPSTLVTTPGGARSMAEVIRERTVAASGGRTYAETEEYVDIDGNPTSDAALARIDERTGKPVVNPQHDLWIESTTLQNGLMQAYMAFRVAELTAAVGATTFALGIGLLSLHARRS